MKIVNCGYNYRHDKNFKINRPNGSGDYLLLILRSPAFFVFNNENYQTNGNSIVLFHEGTPQVYGASSTEYVNDWVHFVAAETEINTLKEKGIAFDKIVELFNVIPLSSLVQNIFHELCSENKNAIESAHLYLEVLLNKISDNCANLSNNSKSELYYKLSNLKIDIFSSPQKDWKIPTIARNLALSESYLQHTYKKFFGRNIKTDITTSRLEYSKNLLLRTDYTISTISQLCGYQNEEHFMRTFKRNVQMTPTEYRKFAIYNKKNLFS